ncbi:GNAT family N-acetyltransferase [Reyranella sp. CPCC 100927]|uniref:GNAT family N-acetyltransferase n=1 Tax=Reyranella sp. CPCC 100927 TaxID=2599616 RepID=UPI0011B51626|nr:GNAT family N-acetyltransferase [Reyranella sp. CPCC 100927]TWS94443.1 GNAT family N-acetyltransferase [Reyranella sp. CPCC 100927]
MTSDIQRLDIQYRTLFRLTANGRIERENDPDRSAGPRLWLAGCAAGNVVGARADVADDVAAEIAALAASEPPLMHADSLPRHLDTYAALLRSNDAKVGLTYELPHGHPWIGRANRVSSDSADGRDLQARLTADGMPSGMVALGFRTVADFWPPWCAAIVDGEIAAIAFAARLSGVGAELGVATVPAFRGQGHAAAAVSGWSHSPGLRSRQLFYSTDRSNIASQGVVRRLGLRFMGANLRIA